MHIPIEELVEQVKSLRTELLEVKKMLTHKIKENPEDDLVDFETASKILCLGPNQLYAIHKRIFPIRKSGKKLLFSKKELLEYINRHNQPPEQVGEKKRAA